MQALVKIGPRYPRKKGDLYAFIHEAKLFKWYRRAKDGEQLKLFEDPKTIIDEWRQNHLKQ